MIVHSDTGLGSVLFFVVMAFSALSLVAALISVTGGNFRLAGKIFGRWSACALAYIALTISVSLLIPQNVVNPGQSYCVDIWCISIQNVIQTPLAQNIAYRVNLRIFSDANTVKTSTKRVSLYLADERGRRFPLIADPSATPFDIELSPGQSVNNSLTFLVPTDAQHLFLKSDGPSLWITKLFIGDDNSLFHRATLIRVL